MKLVIILLVAAAVFGLCYLVDKAFTKVFRGQAQHRSGLSVRLSRKYGSIGLILAVIGLSAVFTGIGSGWLLTAGGAVLIALGVFLVVYYMTFGVFYDEESFILTTFGKKSNTYRYQDIQAQQLYNSYGNILIELHMTDGRTVGLQAGMVGVYPFLDHAFAAWCRQTGRSEADCPFHDPANSCWFPPAEG